MKSNFKGLILDAFGIGYLESGGVDTPPNLFKSL